MNESPRASEAQFDRKSYFQRLAMAVGVFVAIALSAWLIRHQVRLSQQPYRFPLENLEKVSPEILDSESEQPDLEA